MPGTKSLAPQIRLTLPLATGPLDHWLEAVQPWHLAALALAMVAGIGAVLPDQGLPDTDTYRLAGQQFWATGRIASHIVMPGYPLIAGLGETAQRLIDCIATVATVLGVWRLAWALTGRHAIAVLAGAAMAIWPHAAFYAQVGLTEPTYTAFLVWAFAAWSVRRWTFGCVLFVAALIIRPSAYLAGPVLLVLVMAGWHRMPWRACGRALAIYAIVFVAAFTPWWVHQHAKYDRFVFLNLAGGIVWWAGNNPMNRSGGGISGVDVDYAPFADIADPFARNRAMQAAAFDYMAQDPAHTARMALVKIERIWRPLPYAQAYRSPLVVTVSLIAMLPVYLGVLATLALGLRRHFWTLAPILALFGYFTLLHALTIGSVRYRFPLEPFLIVLAAPAWLYAFNAVLVRLISRRAGP